MKEKGNGGKKKAKEKRPHRIRCYNCFTKIPEGKSKPAPVFHRAIFPRCHMYYVSSCIQFCSFHCMKRFFFERKDEKGKQMCYHQAFLDKVIKAGIPLFMAPDRCNLKKFGGDMSTKYYHKYIEEKQNELCALYDRDIFVETKKPAKVLYVKRDFHTKLWKRTPIKENVNINNNYMRSKSIKDFY